jgi:hypothetical protein
LVMKGKCWQTYSSDNSNINFTEQCQPCIKPLISGTRSL